MKRKLSQRERNRRAMQSSGYPYTTVAYVARLHIIHTPVKPTSRLVPIVRTCVLAIENLINFVKGIFK